MILLSVYPLEISTPIAREADLGRQTLNPRVQLSVKGFLGSSAVKWEPELGMDLVQQEMEVGAWGGGVRKGSAGDGLFWGELVLLRSHWVKSVRFCILSLFSFWFLQCGKRKRHHTEGLVWLKSSGACELWQRSPGLSPPGSASRAAQFPDCCVCGAAGARGAKM